MSAAWADELELFEPGQGLRLDKDCQEIPGGALDHLIEAYDMDWEVGERHQLTFNVTPHQAGTLWLRVRNTMKDLRAGCLYHNDASLNPNVDFLDIDQSGWDVIRLEIEVDPASLTAPSKIANPSPADGSMDVPINSVLSWDFED